MSTGFASWLRYCTDVAQRRSTKLCRMFGRLPPVTLYTFSGALFTDGILSGAKFTLRPNLAFSYIGCVTARHSSSRHQPNFAAFSRGRHLYSTGRPSRWTSAHILVMVALWNRADHYIFILWFLLSFFLFSSFFFPPAILPHMV